MSFPLMDGDATSEEIIIMSGADLGVSFRRVREYTSPGDVLDFNFLKVSFRGFLCYSKKTDRTVSGKNSVELDILVHILSL